MEDSPLKDLTEMKANKLSDIEFKRMVIRMLKELIDYKELTENYKSMRKEIESINKYQEEMKNTLSEKNTLEGFTSRLDEAEDQISEFNNKVERNTQVKEQHEKHLKNMKIV